MPKMKAKPRTSLATRVAAALKSGLKLAGFAVEQIETQPIRGTKLFRVTLVAKGFEKLWTTERQDLVWRILNQSFNREEQLQISMIITLSPGELAGV
jgi:hypothetical protein